MVTMCLACYSNWFKNRVDGYLWRCVFWSPIILMICVARQVHLWRLLIVYFFKIYFVRLLNPIFPE